MPYVRDQPALLDLKTAVRENPKNVVFITGAGASKFSGLPLWVELRKLLCADITRLAELSPLGRTAALAVAAEALRDRDLWAAFRGIKVALGPAYVERVRSHLTPPVGRAGDLYERMWRLNVKGIVSFNIDRFAIDAFAKVKSAAVDFATASDIHKIAPHLQSFTEFLFLPHGFFGDPKSWVFDAEDRDRVLTSPPVHNFFATLFLGRQVVVVGLNPNDIAFDKHVIDILSPFGASGIGHFIVCEASALGSLSHLTSNGFKPIIYTPALVDHHREMAQILDDLGIFLPKDKPAVPASTGMSAVPADAVDKTLVIKDVEDQRAALTSLVHKAIVDNRDSEENQVRGIKSVYSAFPRSIHTAWVVEPNGGEFSRLFGRKIVRPIGDGAFGRVFLAEAEDGSQSAVKILLQEVNTDPRYLVSFLRGIRSMRILNENHVNGMVKIHDAYEIPTCVFMEFVDGETLEEVVKKRRLRSLSDTLELLIRIGSIVDEGHRLEDRVLHRDLKPANVMVKAEHGTIALDQVVVLDFDLSWHRGASNQSVFHGKRAEGYAAPEQTAGAPSPGISTRHVAVDVFGFGMVMFFVFTRRDPRAGEQNFPDFRETVQRAIADIEGSGWQSVVPHLAEVVYSCTRDDQGSRPGFSDVVADLVRCRDIVASGRCEMFDPLLLEELALHLNGRIVRRAEFGRAIEIEHESRFVTLSIVDDAGDPACRVDIVRVKDAYHDRARAKYLQNRIERAAKALRRVGFVLVESRGDADRVLVSATLKRQSFSQMEARDVGGAIRSAIAELEF